VPLDISLRASPSFRDGASLSCVAGTSREVIYDEAFRDFARTGHHQDPLVHIYIDAWRKSIGRFLILKARKSIDGVPRICCATV
jgi:hypothetical protein